MRYAVIEQGIVINIIEAGSPLPGMTMVEAGDGQIGDVWDGSSFTRPIPTFPARHITVLAFRNRFTQIEKVAIELAALDNPAGTLTQRQGAAAIRSNLADMAVASYIDLDRADTRNGVQVMETAGIIAAGRATQILDAAVQDVERPQKG